MTTHIAGTESRVCLARSTKHYPYRGVIMEEIVNLFVNNGIGVACVIYLIYFQNTTMTKMLDALNSINTRLSVIEDKLESGR